MKKCTNCHTDLPDEARFCHHCGTPVEPPVKSCPRCGQENPPEARFCAHCGLNFVEKRPPHNVFEPPPTLSTEEEITARFFEVFERKIRQEQDPERLPAYLDRFEGSDFKHTFELRVRQLAEQIEKIRTGSVRPQTEARYLLEDAIEGLSDFFLIRHCQDLNVVPLPEAILRYETLQRDGLDFFRLVMDFLDFPSENETVYTDFLAMPMEKLRNASASFLFPAKDERILFICDQSILGSAKEGFAMTDRALFWKAPLEKPHWVYYSDLQSLEPEKDWLKINGFFFNAGRSLNVKLLKLLRKLQTLYR